VLRGVGIRCLRALANRHQHGITVGDGNRDGNSGASRAAERPARRRAGGAGNNASRSGG
jgi:hypothetical protein